MIPREFTIHQFHEQNLLPTLSLFSSQVDSLGHFNECQNKNNTHCISKEPEILNFIGGGAQIGWHLDGLLNCLKCESMEICSILTLDISSVSSVSCFKYNENCLLDNESHIDASNVLILTNDNELYGWAMHLLPFLLWVLTPQGLQGLGWFPGWNFSIT